MSNSPEQRAADIIDAIEHNRGDIQRPPETVRETIREWKRLKRQIPRQVARCHVQRHNMDAVAPLINELTSMSMSFESCTSRICCWFQLGYDIWGNMV